MQYSEIKTTFTGILNRRDITPSQITTFLTMGAQYCARKLRVPFMEKITPFTSNGTALIAVPSDFIEIIALYTNDATTSVKLERRDLQTVLYASQSIGIPTYYCRVGTNFMIGPKPTSTVYLNYYATPTALVADTDSNWLTINAPTALVYAGLKYAADFFLDDRKQAFADTLGEDLSDVQEQATRDELTNATISPAYPEQNY